jgi:hypothetical protein
MDFTQRQDVQKIADALSGQDSKTAPISSSTHANQGKCALRKSAPWYENLLPPAC